MAMASVMTFKVTQAQDVKHVATHFTNAFDEGAAEIVVHDKDNQRLIFTNAKDNSLTWLDFSDPAKIEEIKSVSMANYGGGVNSVAYYNNYVVAAVEASPKQDAGKLVLFDKDGTYITDVTVGALPDMVTFSKDGKYIITACEGEPNDDYTVDPDGAIGIVDLSNGVMSATVSVLDFSMYNDKMEHLKNKGIRFFGPNATVAQDMEPEYVTVANDSLAYVSCQENNAIAVIDFKNAVILDIYSAGYADHSANGGSVTLEQFILNNQNNWPTLGTPVYGTNTPEVVLGGFSGLFYDSVNSSGSTHIFYAIPDRGPNADAIKKTVVTPATKQDIRPFKLPNYQSRIVKIIYDESTGETKVNDGDQIYLFAKDGVSPISGKGNVPGVDEVPVTYADANTQWNAEDYVDGNGVKYTELSYDPFGGDFEGILRDKAGNFWMCDEYRPAIYKFNAKGKMVERFVSKGIAGKTAGSGIFFSEYGEGSSYNKYLEIYNPTSATINLEDYMLVNNSNDPTPGKLFEFDNSSLFAGRTLAPGEIFIIAHPQAQANILAKADTTFSFLSNGDDWYAILNAADSSIVDQVGDASADPGTAWAVAGVSNATADHTLVRKSSIIHGSANWLASAGTDTETSEWIVLDLPTNDTVMSTYGNHEMYLYGKETLPAVYNKRWANRGFEGIAFDFDNDIIYAFIQSPMYNPSSITKDKSDVIRILGIDTLGNPVAEYVYLLDRNANSGFAAGRVDKIGDAVYMGNGKFRVIERDSGLPGQNESKKLIVEFNLIGATNILGTTISIDGANGKTLEEMSADEIVAEGVRPVNRRVVLNLPSIGYLPSDKAEGLAWMSANKMAVINDNDFGKAGAGVSDSSALGIITFLGNQGFDASDKDDKINITHHDVLGMRMADALTSVTVNGKIYVLTANEGDSRDYDGFSEEERVEDLTLDAKAYPNAAELQTDDAIGRLKTTNTMGDYDNDGDFDQIYSYGSRSFTIYDQFGNIVFDSGDEFEMILSKEMPDDFNSTNDENQSFDNRSDDKGAEPEAITTGVWRDSLYAFIGLERIGGVMVYNITDIKNPRYVMYFNNRDFSETDATTNATGDLGPECVLFLDSTITPDKRHYIVTANEVSGTVSIFEFGDITTGKSDVSNFVEFTLFPNPTNGDVVRSSITDNYQVFDVSGRLVKNAPNTNNITITDLEKGTYIVRNSVGDSKILVKN